jgi:flagellar biosynthesis GTPase FlhF
MNGEETGQREQREQREWAAEGDQVDGWQQRRAEDTQPHDASDGGSSRPFPEALLGRPRAERLAFFATFTVAHPSLERASEEALRAVYDPGGATTVNVIGPTGVGKTTLATWLRRRLIADAKEQLAADPGHVPCICVDATAPSTGRFAWLD